VLAVSNSVTIGSESVNDNFVGAVTRFG
jgi:hypothetical protein